MRHDCLQQAPPSWALKYCLVAAYCPYNPNGHFPTCEEQRRRKILPVQVKGFQGLVNGKTRLRFSSKTFGIVQQAGVYLFYTPVTWSVSHCTLPDSFIGTGSADAACLQLQSHRPAARRLAGYAVLILQTCHQSARPPEQSQLRHVGPLASSISPCPVRYALLRAALC